VLKLINNMVGQAITTATAEGLATAAKVGLDLRALHKLMSLGSVNNCALQAGAARAARCRAPRWCGRAVRERTRARRGKPLA
jgi:3-hydroxyisobutyrate dehydrogenase-like beta-hydroxyacid dehydrogenase